MEKQYFHQSLFLRNILCGTVGSLRGPLPPSPGYIHSRNIVLENNSLFQNIPRNEFPQIANVYIGETRKFKDLDRETIGAKNPSDLRCWGNRSITMSLNLLLTWSGHCRLLPLGNVMTCRRDKKQILRLQTNFTQWSVFKQGPQESDTENSRSPRSDTTEPPSASSQQTLDW